MRKLLFLFSCSVYLINFAAAQNVGIGTTTPAEKLDVNGNVNVAGQLKVNNNAGTAGQVLMKDASNNPAWGDISEFKNQIVYDCYQTIGGGGAGNCSANWTVPAGISKILVECWGGGGGGGTACGGGGGGYVSAKFNVASGNMASLQIGAGGSVIFAGTGATGGTTLFSINGMAIFANGGTGGAVNLSPAYSFTLSSGGAFIVSGIVDNYFGMGGYSGNPTLKSYTQSSTSAFAELTYYGNGGDAAFIPGSGAKGGFNEHFIGGSGDVNMVSTPSQLPGGGGAADNSGGTNGHGGRIIIHY